MGIQKALAIRGVSIDDTAVKGSQQMSLSEQAVPCVAKEIDRLAPSVRVYTLADTLRAGNAILNSRCNL